MKFMLSMAVLASLLVVAESAQASSPVALASPAQTVLLERRDTGTFYVEGVIEGAGAMKMLVDTGSSYVVLGEDVIQKLSSQGMATMRREIRGRMADESVRIVPIYELSGVRLGDKCWVRNVEAAVFPAGARPILGMRILERLSPFTFSTTPASLGLNQCEAGQPEPSLVTDNLEILAN